MPHVRSVLSALAVAGLLTACAGVGTNPSNARAVRITAPRMVSQGPLELRAPANLRIEVLVKADGRPDLRTLKIIGTGDRVAVERWITSSVFEPGRKEGVPVDAIYVIRVETGMAVRRG